MMRKTTKIFSLLGNLLFPNLCVVCGEPTESNLCPQCKGKITFMWEINTCDRCSCPLEEGETGSSEKGRCPDCAEQTFAFSKLISVFLYGGVGETIIRKLKFRGYFGVLEDLSDEIKKVVSSVDFDLIVPVPSHLTRFVRRGYNPSFFIAEVVSDVSGKEVLNILEKARRTPSQLSLSYEDRLINPKDAFVLRERSPVEGKKVLVVDDVATTCATLSECALCLLRGGAGEVFAFSLARTPSMRKKTGKN